MESKKMMKKELSFMKKKGAPKSMIKHEKAEAKGMKKGGMACGGGMKKYAAGGGVAPSGVRPGSPTATRIGNRGAVGAVTVSPVGGSSSSGISRGALNAIMDPISSGRMPAPPPAGTVTVEEVPMARGGKVAKYARGSSMKKYATGGTVKVPPKPYVPTAGDLNEKAGGDQEMENRSQSRGPGRGPMSRNAMKPKGYAAGGMVKADGCAVKGKTKGRFI